MTLKDVMTADLRYVCDIAELLVLIYFALFCRNRQIWANCVKVAEYSGYREQAQLTIGTYMCPYQRR